MSEPVSYQLRVEQTWPRLRGLARLLWTKGLTSDRLRDIWEQRVHVACDACDTRLTRDELLLLLDMAEGVIPAKARLQRLAQGYCVKSGCDSRFYRVLLEPEEGLDWTALWKELDESASANNTPSDETKEDASASSSSVWRRPAVRVAVAVAALLLALGLRQWYLHGKIPFVTRGFEAAPSMSTPFGVSPTPPADSPTPRPTNGFRVAP